MTSSDGPAPKRENSRSFNATKRRCVIRWLRKGNFRSAAAGRAKVAEATVYVWCQRGKKELEDAERAAEESGVQVDVSALGDHARFYIDVCKAEAQAEMRALKKVTSSEDTADARWFLERRHQRRWGRSSVSVEHTGANGGPIQVDVNDARNAFLKKLTGALEREGIALDDPEGGPDPGAEGGTRGTEEPPS